MELKDIEQAYKNLKTSDDWRSLMKEISRLAQEEHCYVGWELSEAVRLWRYRVGRDEFSDWLRQSEDASREIFERFERIEATLRVDPDDRCGPWKAWGSLHSSHAGYMFGENCTACFVQRHRETHNARHDQTCVECYAPILGNEIYWSVGSDSSANRTCWKCMMELTLKFQPVAGIA